MRKNSYPSQLRTSREIDPAVPELNDRIPTPSTAQRDAQARRVAGVRNSDGIYRSINADQVT